METIWRLAHEHGAPSISTAAGLMRSAPGAPDQVALLAAAARAAAISSSVRLMTIIAELRRHGKKN